jgi:hypothetical protein
MKNENIYILKNAFLLHNVSPYHIYASSLLNYAAPLQKVFYLYSRVIPCSVSSAMKKEGAFILKTELIIKSLRSSRIQISLFFNRENWKDSPYR